MISIQMELAGDLTIAYVLAKIFKHGIAHYLTLAKRSADMAPHKISSLGSAYVARVVSERAAITQSSALAPGDDGWRMLLLRQIPSQASLGLTIGRLRTKSSSHSDNIRPLYIIHMNAGHMIAIYRYFYLIFRLSERTLPQHDCRSPQAKWQS